MARTPETVNIGLHELLILLCYRWAAVNTSFVGELGDKTYEEVISAINAQSQIEIKPSQLADLIHHMKECVFEHVQPAKLEFTMTNHNRMMRKLKRFAPNLFKELASGEIVMVDFEDRANV